MLSIRMLSVMMRRIVRVFGGTNNWSYSNVTIYALLLGWCFLTLSTIVVVWKLPIEDSLILQSVLLETPELSEEIDRNFSDWFSDLFRIYPASDRP